jgi:hypothetical protein
MLSQVVNTLLILCLHFSKQTAYCARGGAVVDDFLVIGGSATIFFTQAFMSIRRFFCLDDGDDFDFYPFLK